MSLSCAVPPQRDKSRKAFSYLEAAMYFVESGIAMENDPHISRSSYTMFADTVDLLKYEHVFFFFMIDLNFMLCQC